MTTPAAELVRTVAAEYYDSRQEDIVCGFTGGEDIPWPAEHVVQWLLMYADYLAGTDRRWPADFDVVQLLLTYADSLDGTDQPAPASVAAQLSQPAQPQRIPEALAVWAAAAAFYADHQARVEADAESPGEHLFWDADSVRQWLDAYAQGLEQ